jgi:hypothetical protein
MFCLISLPYEVLSNIIENISFDDVFNLARTCKHFKYLLTEESISKSIIQVSKPCVWVMCLHDAVRFSVFSC